MNKYTDKEYEMLCFYEGKVKESKITYLECFDNYYNFQLKLADKYTIAQLDNLGEHNYVDWERLKILYHNMLIARSYYEKSLRELYNYKIVLREVKFGEVSINDFREGKTDKIYNVGKRQYRGVK